MASTTITTKRKDSTKLSRVIALGDIESEIVNEVIELIYDINEEDAKKTQVEPIKLIVNSPGGNVYHGFALVDVISNSKTPVHTICHGHAMSMALVVFASGHKRFASQRATFMYHEVAWETAQEKLQYHSQELKEGERIWKMYDDYLISRTKFTKKQLTDVRKSRGEWYIDPKTAMKYGLVDEII
jgi:ATP-dependent Clp protease protease subunit